MRYINLYLIIAVVIFLRISTSCNEGTDTQLPEINLISPVEESQFHPGDTIKFECKFSDNEELLSYKIEIHFNADGHTHKSVVAILDEGTWHFSKSWDFEEGTNVLTVKHSEIIIPREEGGHEIAEGEYHLGVYCSDVSGNESHVFIPIDIGHEEHEEH
jgi:hypothetical protein